MTTGVAVQANRFANRFANIISIQSSIQRSMRIESLVFIHTYDSRRAGDGIGEVIDEVSGEVIDSQSVGPQHLLASSRAFTEIPASATTVVQGISCTTYTS